MEDNFNPQSMKESFPAGLRVLVVDDDLTTLFILKQMLRACLYQVTTCEKATKALDFLRKNKGEFDIIISDVHMPDMDGFKLLELVGLEMDLPVIMMSANDDTRTVMKGIIHGACDYLLKPVRMKELRNIWQHVVRKKIKVPEKQRQGSPLNDGMLKRRKDVKDEEEEQETTSKRARVVWSVELHQQFVNAVNHLGLDRAFPKQILELMNIPGLTRENVASHLQKYRLYLRRTSGMDFLQSNGRLDSSSAGALDFHGYSTVGSNAPTNSGAIGSDSSFFAQTASLARPLYLQQQQQQRQQQRPGFLKQFGQWVGPTSPEVGTVDFQSRRLPEGLNHGGMVNPPQTITTMPESWQGDICFDAQLLKSHLCNPSLEIDRWKEESVEFMVGTKAVNNALLLESFSPPDDLLSIFLNQQQEGTALEDFLVGGYGLNHMYANY